MLSNLYTFQLSTRQNVYEQIFHALLNATDFRNVCEALPHVPFNTNFLQNVYEIIPHALFKLESIPKCL